MLQFIIPLIASFLPMFGYALWYVFALSALCWIPCFLRSLFGR